ncbi:MAG TPA: hypothetical protein VF893_08185 [Candidatus Bathyarchaeia archaeon]
MRKAAVALAIAALLSTLVVSLHMGKAIALSSKENLYSDTVVYSRSGIGVNVSLTPNAPENKERNSSVAFTLRILESYSNWDDLVDPSSYHVGQVTLDYYLISGVIVDYDMARAIDALWIYWGDSLNKTQVEEEKSVYHHIYHASFSKSGDTYVGSAILPELSQGTHNLTVWVRAEYNQVTTYDPLWTAFSKTVTFTIDTIAPNVTILAQQNTMFEKPDFLLNFTADESPSKIECSLDGQNNVTIIGNTTLSGLVNGNHNVTVFVTDKAGNTGVSETLFFTIAEPDPFPVLLAVVGSAATVAAALVGANLLLLHQRKHRSEVAGLED